MAADPTVLDDIDREILRVLERDGRIGWQQLGPKVGLSPNAAAERVKAMKAAEAAGFVRPCALDVASGAEVAPGVKDMEKVDALMKALGR